jgi:hypothetical protein
MARSLPMVCSETHQHPLFSENGGNLDSCPFLSALVTGSAEVNGSFCRHLSLSSAHCCALASDAAYPREQRLAIVYVIGSATGGPLPAQSAAAVLHRVWLSAALAHRPF